MRIAQQDAVLGALQVRELLEPLAVSVQRLHVHVRLQGHACLLQGCGRAAALYAFMILSSEYSMVSKS